MNRRPVHSLPATSILAAFLVGWALLWLGILPAAPHDAMPTATQPLGCKLETA